MSDAERVWRDLVEVLFHLKSGSSPAKTPLKSHDDDWWQDAVSMSNAWLVTPVFWARIRNTPEAYAGLSSDMRAYLDALLELALSRNTAILKQLKSTIALLADHRIPAIPIKGAAYLLQGLDETTLRHTADIDLVVPTTEAERSRTILLSAGYQDAQLTLENDHHHLMPLVHPEREAGIELHTEVLPRYVSAALGADEVRARARTVIRNGIEYQVPHPTDAAALSFLHAEIVDLGTRLWLIPLREFMDLDMLFRRFGTEIDWEEVAIRTARVNGSTTLRRYAYVYERLTGNRLFPNVRYSARDAISYRLSVASINNPRILNWRRRAHLLSERRMRRKYGISEGQHFSMGVARVREARHIIRSMFRR